jgi:hypothetical protein
VARYGQAYKDRIVARLLPPESSSVEHVSREVAISVATLERWRAGWPRARRPPRGLSGRTAAQPATLEWADPQLDTGWRRHPQPGARQYRPGGNLTNPAFRFDRRTCFPVPTWQRPSHGAQRRRWEEQSHPQPRTARPVAREHGEAGEHRTFSAVSTVAHSSFLAHPLSRWQPATESLPGLHQ